MQETQETQVPPLGREDPLEKDMAPHSSILSWEIPLQRSLACYSPWGHKELDMTKRLSHTSLISISQSVQSLSRVRLFVTPWISAHQASLSITNSRSLLKLMPIELVMPSSHLILCCPLLLLPSIPPSLKVFSNESTLRMRWPKHWSFSFSISPSNEHPGLISFRMDWLDLLAVQGTLKSLLQHHSSKASIFQCSAFFLPSIPGLEEIQCLPSSI